MALRMNLATADRKRGVIPWEKITTEKTMTIYGAYDADKTIKFEFKADNGHDVYQVADLTAFNACDLTGATKMDEVCALFLRDDFFLCTCLSKRVPFGFCRLLHMSLSSALR